MIDYVGPRGGLLDLGRSCVLREYRTNATIQLLWRGISTYISDHGISFMFGCASFPGTDPQQHALALSYLHAHHLPPQERSEERRVGKECVRTCRSRWSQDS